MGKIYYYQCNDEVEVSAEIKGICLFVDQVIKNCLPEPQTRSAAFTKEHPKPSAAHLSNSIAFLNSDRETLQMNTPEQLLSNLLQDHDTLILNLYQPKDSARTCIELYCHDGSKKFYFKVVSVSNVKIKSIACISHDELSKGALTTIAYIKEKEPDLSPTM